jgi:hypothetical protein
LKYLIIDFFILYLDKTPLTHIFQDKISSLIINVVQYKMLDVNGNSNSNIFACIFTAFSKLKYLDYRPSFWCQSLFKIPPTISSSMLSELHIKLFKFIDCLYLLDGRFNSLKKMSVYIYYISNSEIVIDNKVNCSI